MQVLVLHVWRAFELQLGYKALCLILKIVYSLKLHFLRVLSSDRGVCGTENRSITETTAKHKIQ